MEPKRVIAAYFSGTGTTKKPSCASPGSWRPTLPFR